MGTSLLGMALPRATCRPHQRGNLAQEIRPKFPPQERRTLTEFRESFVFKTPALTLRAPPAGGGRYFKAPEGPWNTYHKFCESFALKMGKTPRGPPSILAGPLRLL